MKLMMRLHSLKSGHGRRSGRLVHEKYIGISWITHTSLSDDEGLFYLLADRAIDWLCGNDAFLKHTVPASDGNICTKR